VILGPSEADPHRFSDAAALATPPAPAPMPNGYESNASPGAAGPAASDALYFVGHSGGHRASRGTAPAQAKEEPQGYEPQLLANSEVAREPFDPYRVKRDFPILQTAGARKAADLARQRRDERKSRKPSSTVCRISTNMRTRTSIVPPTRSRRARPTPMKPRAKKFAAF